MADVLDGRGGLPERILVFTCIVAIHGQVPPKVMTGKNSIFYERHEEAARQQEDVVRPIRRLFAREEEEEEY